ncbi:MAG TPA: hypothetical protein P5569_03610, partial [Candidatus Latescibacteria bacterium]|nr:hypothetical protein [Candidatus Latescibacterota bacterium]
TKEHEDDCPGRRAPHLNVVIPAQARIQTTRSGLRTHAGGVARGLDYARLSRLESGTWHRRSPNGAR